MNASDQNAVREASDRIDRALAVDPDSKGSALGSYYTYRDDPLAVLYSVNPGDRMVTVVAVRMAS
jgi:hypothetical protein